MKRVDIYTDGSYNKNKPSHTYGAFYCPELNIKDVFKTSVEEATSMWNVGGELLAAICAITFVTALAEKLEDTKEDIVCNLYYDYEGVGKWAKREWKAKKPMTAAYRDYVTAKLNTHPNLKVNFIWVKGHGGTEGNEMADSLAYSGTTGEYEAKDMDELVRRVLGR